MLPLGSTRPDQPLWPTTKSPRASDDCNEANSTGRSVMSKPASAPMAWISSNTCCMVVLLPKVISNLTRSSPASFSSACAFLGSRPVCSTALLKAKLAGGNGWWAGWNMPSPITWFSTSRSMARSSA